MSEHPKYEYKFVLVVEEKLDNGDWKTFTTSDATEEINRLGLDGWMVRSHTMKNDSHPIIVSYLMVRKL